MFTVTAILSQNFFKITQYDDDYDDDDDYKVIPRTAMPRLKYLVHNLSVNSCLLSKTKIWDLVLNLTEVTIMANLMIITLLVTKNLTFWHMIWAIGTL